MPKNKLIFTLFLLFVFIGFSFIALQTSKKDSTIFVFINPSLFKSNKYLAINTDLARPIIALREYGVFDSSSAEKYNSVGYDYFTKYLSAMAKGEDLYWSNWDWQEKIVILHATSLSRLGSSGSFNIARPEFITGNDVLKDVSLQCDPENTFVLNKSNLSVTRHDVNVFDEMSVGSVLYTFCNDESCSGVGRNFCGIVDVR